MADKPAKEEALLADMAAWVKAHFPSVADSGIVYCLTRKVGAEVPAGERWPPWWGWDVKAVGRSRVIEGPSTRSGCAHHHADSGHPLILLLGRTPRP